MDEQKLATLTKLAFEESARRRQMDALYANVFGRNVQPGRLRAGMASGVDAKDPVRNALLIGGCQYLSTGSIIANTPTITGY